MDNIIDVSIPVAEVVDKHPEVLEILVELGFKPLANPLMRNTVGRKVSLKQGSKLEGTYPRVIKNGEDLMVAKRI